ELLELGRRERERRRGRLRGAPPARRQLVLVRQRAPDALLRAREHLVAQNGRLEPVGREFDARRTRAPGPLAAAARVAFLDEAPLGERAQVVAARRGALVDELRAFRRRRLADRVQMVEQREAGRMRESPHRAGVVDQQRVLERHLSKDYFQYAS